MQPKLIGPCEMSAPRWYYDSETGQCAQFLYGGCDGNNNNFHTLATCMRTCENKSDKMIKIEPMPGQQVAKVNRCDSCSENPFSYANQAENEVEDNPCELEPTAGPCRALLPRYYFDSRDGTCKKFLYGGCSGNTNNFMTEVACMDKCGPSDQEEEPKEGRAVMRLHLMLCCMSH